MIKLIVLSICTFLWISLNGQESDVHIRLDDGILAGSLLMASNDEGRQTPVVLMIAGSGPTDRNCNQPQTATNAFKMLADSLAHDGISSLRIDKRGIGQSSFPHLKEIDYHFDTLVNDAVRWIEYLHQLNRFNQVVVLGHSQGALVGMLACQEADVDKFISLAGAGFSANEVIKKQINERSPYLLNVINPIMTELEAGRLVDSVPAYLNSLFRPSVQPFLISYFQYDPVNEIKKLDMPIAIVQGTTDIQVKQEDAEILLLASPSSIGVIIEGMNHVLKPAPIDLTENMKTYNDPVLPLHQKLATKMATFILQ